MPTPIPFKRSYRLLNRATVTVEDRTHRGDPSARADLAPDNGGADFATGNTPGEALRALAASVRHLAAQIDELDAGEPDGPRGAAGSAAEMEARVAALEEMLRDIRDNLPMIAANPEVARSFREEIISLIGADPPRGARPPA